MNLTEQHVELSKGKRKVLLGYLSLPEKEKYETNFADYCENNHKEYSEKVLMVIHYLAALTLEDGHSDKLDIQKDRFYKLLGL